MAKRWYSVSVLSNFEKKVAEQIRTAVVEANLGDEIDEVLSGKLAAGWKIERLDKTMLQILRAGTYELMARADVPIGSAISEYVDVAHAFFDPREAKFVNGVLDAVAKAVR